MLVTKKEIGELRDCEKTQRTGNIVKPRRRAAIAKALELLPFLE